MLSPSTASAEGAADRCYLDGAPDEKLSLGTIVRFGFVAFYDRVYRQPDRPRKQRSVAASSCETVVGDHDRTRTKSQMASRRDRETLMGSMEEFIHYENLIIAKGQLADPSITDEQRQMFTRLLTLEQARDVPEKADPRGMPRAAMYRR